MEKKLTFLGIETSCDETASSVVQENGDGTAKVQSDDILRSKTIAKITSTVKQKTYSDNSFLVTCTLHCG